MPGLRVRAADAWITLITLPDAVKYPTFRLEANKPRITTLLVVYKLIETEDKNKFHPSIIAFFISFIPDNKKEILNTFIDINKSGNSNYHL